MTTTQVHLTGAEFLKDRTKGLSEPSTPESLGLTAQRAATTNRAAIEAVPQFQDWRRAAQEVKRYVVANLDKLLVEFERKMTAHGATVLWAADAKEANEHVLASPASTTSKAW